MLSCICELLMHCCLCQSIAALDTGLWGLVLGVQLHSPKGTDLPLLPFPLLLPSHLLTAVSPALPTLLFYNLI